MVICPTCKAENPNGAKVCAHCGASLEAAQQALVEPPPAKRSGFITHAGFWGSLMIIVGFFTNWIDLESHGGITGLQILTSLNEVIGGRTDGILIFQALEISIIIILVSALVCLAYILGVKIAKGAFIFFKILPLLTIIGLIAMVAMQIQEGRAGDNYNELKNSVWQVLGAGIYLTLLGSLLLIISRIRR